MKKITVIGGGPGNEAYILPAARQKAAACDRIAGDRRILESFGISAEDERVHVMDRIMETMAWIGAQDSETHIGILVSGDPMLYSLYRMVVRTFPAAEVDIVPGISSVQAFAARLGNPWRMPVWSADTDGICRRRRWQRRQPIVQSFLFCVIKSGHRHGLPALW